MLIKTNTSCFGHAGSINILFSAPIFLIALLASIYLHIFKSHQTIMIKQKTLIARLWTHLIFTKGPLGIVTVGELVILLIFVALLAWTTTSYIVNGVDGSVHMKISPEVKRWHRTCIVVATCLGRLGLVGTVGLAFLFFPITRGSMLLQLLNISFENSVKYHIWIAHMTMVLITVHGMSYLLIWGLTNRLQEMLQSWQRIGYPILPGEIALLAGLIMWVTSLKPIRQRFFEIFYYTHHLYLVFIVFFAMHIGETLFSLVLPGIFLFLLDRYIRFLQSQRAVNILSATKLPSKIVHLVMAKHPGLEYNPLSVILLKLPFLSCLEWHPFSIISSSSIESDRLSILIKCQQSWTQKLDNFMESQINSAGSPLHLAAAIEGPYGPAFNYFLRYETLILIGGGSGIAPLMSMLSEVLHHYSTGNGDHVARDVTLIWAVKQTQELCILHEMVCPRYSEMLKLQGQVYITQDEAPDPEMDGPLACISAACLPEKTVKTVKFQEPNGCASAVHSISSTDNTLWQGAVILCSIVGFLAVVALLNRFYIYPIDNNSYEEYPWWGRALITIGSMFMGIVVFGGFAFMAWRHRNKSKIRHDTPCKEHQRQQAMDTVLAKIVQSKGNIHYRRRPNFQAIIDQFATEMDGRDVGVFVCGPKGMQSGVASACTSHNSFLRAKSSRAFYFHYIGFNI